MSALPSSTGIERNHLDKRSRLRDGDAHRDENWTRVLPDEETAALVSPVNVKLSRMAPGPSDKLIADT